MKKALFSALAMCAIALCLSACSSDEIDEYEQNIISYSTEMESVDLGLPSHTMWGTMNVGANCPEAYGDYFAWGDSISRGEDWKTDLKKYNWINAPFNNGQKNCDQDYFKTVFDTVCPSGTLSEEHDAATQLCGSDWRMPTADEWFELYTECEWEWTDDYNGKGIKGYIVHSVDKTTHIFLPGAGKRSYASYSEEGQGFYWSSTPKGISTYALCLYFNRNNINADKYPYYRYYGFTIRPVRK